MTIEEFNNTEFKRGYIEAFCESAKIPVPFKTEMERLTDMPFEELKKELQEIRQQEGGAQNEH